MLAVFATSLVLNLVMFLQCIAYRENTAMVLGDSKKGPKSDYSAAVSVQYRDRALAAVSVQDRDRALRGAVPRDLTERSAWACRGLGCWAFIQRSPKRTASPKPKGGKYMQEINEGTWLSHNNRLT
eukprot:FR736792.1.p1 GENE.FR736792.1~~FR736792.1.p1  ORF type:complete len:126 (+),score=7.22 FR736792.1:266-643(+)